VEDLGEDGRIILKCMFEKQVGFLWLGIWTGDGSTKHGDEPSSFLKGGELPDSAANMDAVCRSHSLQTQNDQSVGALHFLPSVDDRVLFSSGHQSFAHASCSLTSQEVLTPETEEFLSALEHRRSVRSADARAVVANRINELKVM
jgi:hypothetical protein